MKKKITTPWRPPTSPPISINSPVISPSSRVVLKKLIALLVRDLRVMSDDAYAISVLFLRCVHKFCQSACDFLALDRIDWIAPQNCDSPTPQRTPSHRICRAE